ncbi:flotillin domain-containing protein [Brevibacterium sp. H602]|uniref:flotillin domain-containing protein n=1 Tax=Brevibacterium sp. H602 TaxID=3444316 RepID=UPI003EB8730F
MAKEAAELRAEQLDAEVRRPADAERYRQQAAADARAYEIEAQGRAEAAAELHRRSKDAEAIRLEGEAEADAIRARGEAEAEALRAQAEAYKQFNEAAVLSKVLEVLPSVAGELVAPYANIKDLSIVSTDGESKLANSVSNNLSQVLEVVRGTTGVDLTDLVAKAKRSGGAGSSGDGSGEPGGNGGSGEPGRNTPGGSSGTGRSSSEVVDGVVADDASARSRSTGTGFDPKAFLDDSGVDLDRIGDEVKKATGFDVQAYIDEAKRRLDESGASTSRTDAADIPDSDEPGDDQDDDSKGTQS